MIETSRLVLRPYTPDDLPALHAILSDPVTMQWWPQPFTLEQSSAWLQRHLHNIAHNKPGRFAVILKASGALIGDCGIMEAVVAGQPELDLGYIFDHRHWGRGYATEAAAAVKQYAFAQLGLPRLVANMPVDHLGSRRVAEHIGMRLEREFHNARNRGILTCLYAVEQAEPPVR